MLEDASVISAIIEKRAALSPERALLVGISGIDAAGKGFVAARIAESLVKRGIKPAVISVDGWLNLPHVRFQRRNPAKHFYGSAIRFDEMFERVILPLRDTRSINVESDFAEETATTFRKHRYDFCKIDIVILEGIFLLKPAYRHHFDLTIWIDCSSATGGRSHDVRKTCHRVKPSMRSKRSTSPRSDRISTAMIRARQPTSF